MDNDAYGHVNNVIYYSWFDTAVNRMLIEEGLLDLASSPVVSLVAETGCSFFESVAFPEVVDCGLAVTRLGRSSIAYALAVFRPEAELAAAQGRFVHVCVERASRRPVEIPAAYRQVLERLAR